MHSSATRRAILATWKWRGWGWSLGRWTHYIYGCRVYLASPYSCVGWVFLAHSSSVFIPEVRHKHLRVFSWAKQTREISKMPQKCAKCEKTVYPMEELPFLDKVSFTLNIFKKLISELCKNLVSPQILFWFSRILQNNKLTFLVYCNVHYYIPKLQDIRM